MIKCSNYIAVYDYGDVKLKGCFEIDKELHKDPGMRIVPIALKNYFVDGIPIEETIRNHKDIYDFCLEFKVNSEWQSIYKQLIDSNINSTNLGRITRYFISGQNGSLIKRHKIDGRITQIHKGYGIKLFNKFYNSDDYDINYQFYEIEARKVINNIEDKQLKLF